MTTSTPPSVTVEIDGVHESGLLARLVSVLNTLPVDGFSYRVEGTPVAGGPAHALVEVGGGAWHHRRAVEVLRRVVGVTRVEVRESVSR